MAEHSTRTHPRVAVDIGVKLRLPSGETVVGGQIKNLSLGGVFIEIADPPAFGIDLDLEFSLPAAPRTLRCKGFVVWSTKSNPEKAPGLSGVGVRLMNIGVQEMRLLSDFVQTRFDA